MHFRGLGGKKVTPMWNFESARALFPGNETCPTRDKKLVIFSVPWLGMLNPCVGRDFVTAEPAVNSRSAVKNPKFHRTREQEVQKAIFSTLLLLNVQPESVPGMLNPCQDLPRNILVSVTCLPLSRLLFGNQEVQIFQLYFSGLDLFTLFKRSNQE